MKSPYCIKICTKCNRLLVANNMNFAKQKNGKYGYMSKCKECRKKYDAEHKEHIAEYYKQHYENNTEHIKERNKQYYENNKEHAKDYNKQYNSEHKEQIAEYMKQYYENNKDQYAEYAKQYNSEHKEEMIKRNKQWREANKEQYAENHKRWKKENRERYNELALKAVHKRRALKAQNGGEYTLEQWNECLEFFDYKCAYSGAELTKDNTNVEHIIPISKGGTNNIYNIVPALDTVNKSKNASDMLEWYKEQPYYSEERLNKILDWIEYASNKYELNTISI